MDGSIAKIHFSNISRKYIIDFLCVTSYTRKREDLKLLSKKRKTVTFSLITVEIYQTFFVNSSDSY